MTSLALMYDHGDGVEQDYEKAFEYYTLAAEQGEGKAFNNLGDMYENGHGMEQDYEKAAEYYRKAAEMGIVEAEEALKRVTDPVSQ